MSSFLLVGKLTICLRDGSTDSSCWTVKSFLSPHNLTYCRLEGSYSTACVPLPALNAPEVDPIHPAGGGGTEDCLLDGWVLGGREEGRMAGHHYLTPAVGWGGSHKVPKGCDVEGREGGTDVHRSLSKYLTAQDTRGTPILTNHSRTLTRLGKILYLQLGSQ